MSKKKYVLLLITLFVSQFLIAGTDYLILYHNSFSDPNGWQNDLRNILEGNGHTIIFQSIQNGNTNSQIRSMISSVKTSYPALRYVLLIGKGKDNPIPQGGTFPVYNHVANSSAGNFIPFYYYINHVYWAEQIRDIPSDRQYVEGLNLLIGRVPAETISQIQIWVSKLNDYYSQFTTYHSYNKKIRFFCQNNYNIDNACWSAPIQDQVNESIENFVDPSKYECDVHFMKDIRVSVHCDHSEEADSVFRNKFSEGAGFTVVSGTGGDSDNLAGFFFNPGISNYSFNGANSNFIWGNTCTLGNTSHSDPAKDNVLKNLLFHSETGLVGFYAPTVVTTLHSTHVCFYNMFEELFDNQVNFVGELAEGFYDKFFSTTIVPYIPPISTENGIYRKFNPEEKAYHAKSMVLFGDPSMPLALYQYKNSNINENTEWNGSIIVENDISVSSGITLTIRPGTGIFFKNNAQLKVYGTLIAQGNLSYPIKFSAATENPTVGCWDGIRFEDSSIDANCIIKYCDIQYAQYGVYCNYAKPKIENNTITNNNYGVYLYYSSPSSINTNNISYNSSGVYGISSSPTLTDNLLYMNGNYGAYFFGGAPYFSTNSFKRNEVGAYFSNSSTPKFGPTSGEEKGNNVVYDNDVWGVRAQFYSSPFMGSSDAYNNRIGGYNSISSNSQANAYAYYYSDIEAQWNWWGSNPPPENQFMWSCGGTIDYSNYLTSNPGGGSSLGKITSTMVTNDNQNKEYQAAGFNPKKPNPNRLSDLWLWGHDLYINNKIEDAIQVYKILVKKFPMTEQSKNALVKIYHWSQEIRKDNISTYLNEIINNPEISENIKPMAYNLLADTYLNNKDLSNAVVTCEKIIDKYPKTDSEKSALFNLVLACKNDFNNLENAQKYLEDLKQKYPEDEITFYAREALGEKVDWSLAKRIYEPQPEAIKQILPEKFALRSNYPNPFNPRTTIAFDLPEESHVTLTIYDVMGREIVRLLDENQPAGFRHVVWDGKDKSGQTVSSGIYLYTLKTPARQSGGSAGFSETKKMALMR